MQNYNAKTLPPHIAFTRQFKRPAKVNLSDSTAQARSFSQVCELTQTDVSPLQLSYAPVQGGQALRKKIALFHQQLNDHENLLNEDNVITFCGAQEALASIYQLLLKPRDEVIVITPCYPSLVSMAKDAGARVVAIALCEEQQWQFDFALLERSVSDKTKLIVINSPHNPTGMTINKETSEKILALAKKLGCYLLIDDVSQATSHHGDKLAHNYLSYERTICVSVLSKSFGLSGLRVGWAISKNLALIEQLVAIKSVSSICCSTLDEALATDVVRDWKKIIPANNKQVIDNVNKLSLFIKNNHSFFEWHAPSAGLLGLVKIKHVTSVTFFCQKLMEKHGILLLPSSLFYHDGPYVRIGLGQENFADGLAQLQAVIDSDSALFYT